MNFAIFVDIVINDLHELNARMRICAAQTKESTTGCL
jgi:hypothetical protein